MLVINDLRVKLLTCNKNLIKPAQMHPDLAHSSRIVQLLGLAFIGCQNPI